ncbi:MAG: hypothetical protein SGILL_007321, partial [Bacillariaceae sp.]
TFFSTIALDENDWAWAAPSTAAQVNTAEDETCLDCEEEEVMDLDEMEKDSDLFEEPLDEQEEKVVNSTIVSDKIKCNWKKKLCGPNSYDIRVSFPSSKHQRQFIQTGMDRPIAMAVDLWSRAIQTRPNRVPQTLRLSRALRMQCGTMFPEHFNKQSNRTMTQLNFDLMVCLQMQELPENDSKKTVGTAQVLLDDPDDGLPRIVAITLSSDAHHLHDCDWANVIAHEIGHALGFGTAVLPHQHLLGSVYNWETS